MDYCLKIFFNIVWHILIAMTRACRQDALHSTTWRCLSGQANACCKISLNICLIHSRLFGWENWCWYCLIMKWPRGMIFDTFDLRHSRRPARAHITVWYIDPRRRRIYHFAVCHFAKSPWSMPQTLSEACQDVWQCLLQAIDVRNQITTKDLATIGIDLRHSRLLVFVALDATFLANKIHDFVDVVDDFVHLFSPWIVICSLHH